MSDIKRINKLWALVSSGAALTSILLTVFVLPEPTPFQNTIFRVLISLLAAGFCATIPGYLTVATRERKAFLSIGGALAVFILVFYSIPTVLEKPDNEIAKLKEEFKAAQFALVNQQLDSSRDLYNNILRSYRDIGSRQGEAQALIGLGQVEYQADNLLQAEKYYKQSLDIYLEIGNREKEAESYYYLGNTKHKAADQDNALKFFNKSLEIYKVIGNRTQVELVQKSIDKITKMHNK